MSIEALAWLVAVLLAVALVLMLPRWFPRPLMREPELSQAPLPETLVDMARQLSAREAQEPRIIPGAEAMVRFANPDHPQPTAVSYLYLHGLSACRQETAPVTETLALQDGANAVYARIAGHGMGDQAMSEVDGATWLESVWDFWRMAAAAGREVVIVATSTGATSATWLVEQPGVQARVRAMLFMAPNYKVRHPLGSVLAWYGVERWLPKVVKPNKRWHSTDARQARYWSTNYGNRALIQMQLLINRVRQSPVESIRVPLMIQCSPEDPVIDPSAAREVYWRWGGTPKRFRWVEVPAGESPHVFVGDILAPHRNEEVIQAFREFLNSLGD